MSEANRPASTPREHGSSTASDGPRHIVVLNWRDVWHPEGGGSELYVSEVNRRLQASGHRVTVFCARYDDAAAQEVRDGVRYVRRGGHLTVYLWAALLLTLARVGVGSFRGVDRVLEVQNGMPFLARLFSAAPVTVLVHHVHREQWSIFGPLVARFGWFMESRVAVRVNRGLRYIAVSEVTRSELVDLGVTAGDIDIAWNGAPAMPDFAAEPTSPTPHLVVVARLVPHKRVEHAMETVALLRSRHPGLRLTVMGSGWWQDQLLARRAALGLDDRVTFAGHVSEEEKYRLLSTAWVHLLPSLKEGWGLAIIEAAQVGVPSVAYSAAGGVSESILDGVTGLLAGEETPSALAAQVDRLLTDQDERRTLGEKAQIRATELTWDATTERVARALALSR
ncbi:glycosyltransferase family 4 protein [Nocardioides sambongensis]|uniref:glycosyltransferase family 4 protein n=1 Tax=Nocardioides sambongensis TaxID=2589074 RepID=UPI0015E873AE|nr:glycosyltransferase family 4 protein [Nocardioides sambongensis]